MFLIKNDFWEVKKTSQKGQGIFCKKNISAGTVIGDYLGKVIHILDYDLTDDEKGLYLMYLTDEACIYPDLTQQDLHLINHSCSPNCWMYIYKGHTLFFAIRDIKPHEELTISYAMSPKEDTCDNCTHICSCGSSICNGTFHLTKDKYEMWQKFQKKERKKTKTVKFQLGKKIKKLTSYPDRLPIDPIYFKISSLE
jgi:SET domain-containing protein